MAGSKEAFSKNAVQIRKIEKVINSDQLDIKLK